MMGDKTPVTKGSNLFRDLEEVEHTNEKVQAKLLKKKKMASQAGEAGLASREYL